MTQNDPKMFKNSIFLDFEVFMQFVNILRGFHKLEGSKSSTKKELAMQYTFSDANFVVFVKKSTSD